MPRKSIKTETSKDLLKQIETAQTQLRKLRTKIGRYERARRGVNFVKLEEAVKKLNQELISTQLDVIRNDGKKN